MEYQTLCRQARYICVKRSKDAYSFGIDGKKAGNYSPPLVLPALLLVRHLRSMPLHVVGGGQESSEKTCPDGTPYNVSPAATMLLTGFLPSQE